MTHYASGKNPLRCNTYFICGLAVIMVAGFYLTLTSKSSVYKDNKPSSFIVQLRPEVTLKGFWSVALVEMFLPKETELKPKYVTDFSNDAKDIPKNGGRVRLPHRGSL